MAHHLAAEKVHQLVLDHLLAVELAVNPNTVIKAYSELEREGLLTTEQGSGTFISPQAPAPLPEETRQAKLLSLCSEFLAQAARYGFSSDDVVKGILTLADKRSPP